MDMKLFNIHRIRIGTSGLTKLPSFNCIFLYPWKSDYNTMRYITIFQPARLLNNLSEKGKQNNYAFLAAKLVSFLDLKSKDILFHCPIPVCTERSVNRHYVRLSLTSN